MTQSSFTRAYVCMLLASCSMACSGGDQGDPVAGVSEEIVGGVEAEVGAWPTVVSIDNSSHSGPWWCGGTLVAPDVVLTAEHCVSGITAGELTIVAGRHDLTAGGGTTHAVSSIVTHPTADVALLQLATSVAGVSPSRLVAPARMAEIKPGDTTTTLGWGALSEGGDSSDTLQQVDVEVVGVGSECESVTDYPTALVSVDSSEICIGEMAGGQDSCQGDSGGPVFVKRDGEFFLLGVTSEGEGCARADLPGVYAYVPGVFDWLHANMVGEPSPSLLPSAVIVSI